MATSMSSVGSDLANRKLQKVLQRELEQSAMNNIRLLHFDKLPKLPFGQLMVLSQSIHSLYIRSNRGQCSTIHLFSGLPMRWFTDRILTLLVSSESGAGPRKSSVILASSVPVPGRLCACFLQDCFAKSSTFGLLNSPWRCVW